MSAETAVALAFAALWLMVAATAAIAVLVLADVVTTWPASPRHRRAAFKSPGVQLWTRSTSTHTVSIPVVEAKGRRVA